MSRTYPFAHWALTLLSGPFTSEAIHYFFGPNPHQVAGLLEVYPITLAFSIAFSLPALLVYLVCFYFLSKHHVNIILSKIILIAVSVSGICITQSLIDGSLTRDIIIAYSATSIIIGLLLKLKRPAPTIPVEA